jgi:hypothetical protein
MRNATTTTAAIQRLAPHSMLHCYKHQNNHPRCLTMMASQDARVLCDELTRGSSDLTEMTIDLRRNGLMTDEDRKALFKALKQNKSLVKLTVKGSLSMEATVDLADVLLNHPTLTMLYVKHVCFQESFSPIILSIKQNSKCQRFTLSGA